MSARHLPARTLFAFVLVLLFSTSVRAQETVDKEAVAAIRKHGLEQSKVMETMGWLTDVHGPRLTGSPLLDQASRWAVRQLTDWGLRNAALEPWGPFGRGWTLKSFSMHAVAPTNFPIIGYPQAWSPTAEGEAEVIHFAPKTEEEFATYRGKLKGKIVFVDEFQPIRESFEPLARRRTPEELLGLANATGAPTPSRYTPEVLARYRFQQTKLNFLLTESPALVVDRATSKGGYGTMYVAAASVPTQGRPGLADRPAPWNNGMKVIPQVTIAEEHYNRILRLLQKGMPVRLSYEIEAAYNEDDPMEANVVAEIPGTDLAGEVVMLGAHLDSWHAGTGAQDNAAGVAVMMEATRILQEVIRETGKKPRRTIRIALWTGEEQGLFGSRAYVTDHFADVQNGRLIRKPDYDRFSAYYNLDNGSGKIRGIYLQGNEALRPIFRAWLEPFHDLDASTVSVANTGSTDHIAFDQVGLPGFQFIQDHVQYGRVYHSNMDVYDHVLEDDLKQAATIIASFVYHTAQRDERLPRKPLTEPLVTF